MSFIYHLAPATRRYSWPENKPYLPADYEKDGFIHCTKGDELMIKVANHFLRDVPGDFVSDGKSIQNYLIEQVTHSVCWEQGIRKIEEEQVDLYLEFGPGTALAGMNKRIGVRSPTISIKNVDSLSEFAKR